MDIDQLRTFLEVNRMRHFGMASRNLFVSQSAISARIRLLEESLRTQLFVRARNDIRLTPAGKRLLPFAETILRLWEEAKSSVALADSEKIQLVIGGVITLWDILLHDWFQQLHHAFPNLALHGVTHGAEAQIQALLNRTIDIGYLFEAPCMTELKVREAAIVELVMVATTPNLTAKEAVRAGYVMVNWGDTFAVTHDQVFADMPPPTVYMALGAMALRFILQCGGSGYLAMPMVDPHLASGQLHLVADAPTFKRSAYAVYLARGSQVLVVEQVLDFLQTRAIGLTADGQHQPDRCAQAAPN